MEIHSGRARLDTIRINAYISIDAGFCRNPGGMHMSLPPKHNLYFISMAAQLLDMHPQTLRKYERLGLVRPSRTIGSMRLYSEEELERLKLIKHLVDELGINLAGVQRLLTIAESVQRIRPLVHEDSDSPEARRRLAREIKRIGEMVGL